MRSARPNDEEGEGAELGAGAGTLVSTEVVREAAGRRYGVLGRFKVQKDEEWAILEPAFQTTFPERPKGGARGEDTLDWEDHWREEEGKDVVTMHAPGGRRVDYDDWEAARVLAGTEEDGEKPRRPTKQWIQSNNSWGIHNYRIKFVVVRQRRFSETRIFV